MSTESAYDVIGRACTANRLGAIVVTHLIDVDTAEAVTLVYAEGCAFERSVFMHSLLAELTGHGGFLNVETKDRLIALWSRVSLPENVRGRLSNEIVPNFFSISSTIIRTFFRSRAHRDDMPAKDQIRLFLDEIEEATLDGMRDPVYVRGLSDLFAPVIYRLPWEKSIKDKPRNLFEQFTKKYASQTSESFY